MLKALRISRLVSRVSNFPYITMSSQTIRSIGMITVIGIPNCDTIRKTRKWLDEKKVEYAFVDVKKEPLTRSELIELASMVTFDTLVNRRGTTWRSLALGDVELDDQQMLDLLEKNQTMIKRPVLVNEEGAVMVGFDEDALAQFVEDSE